MTYGWVDRLASRRGARTRDEKAFELAKTRDAGQSLKAILENEAVREWMEGTQKQLVSKLTAAAGGDTELLRVTGLQLQVFLQFKRALGVAASNGEVAAKQLEKMTDA